MPRGAIQLGKSQPAAILLRRRCACHGLRHIPRRGDRSLHPWRNRRIGVREVQRPRGLQDRQRVAVGVDHRRRVFPFSQRRKVERQQIGREETEFVEDGDELGVGDAHVVGMQQERFLFEDRADLVKLVLADLIDALADLRHRHLLGGGPFPHVGIDAGMKQQPPVDAAEIGRRQFRELVFFRPGDQHHPFRQRGFVVGPQFVHGDEPHEPFATDHVGFAMGHADPWAGDFQFVAQHAAQHARQDKERAGIAFAKRALNPGDPRFGHRGRGRCQRLRQRQHSSGDSIRSDLSSQRSRGD